jgi:hypothetical protein
MRWCSPKSNNQTQNYQPQNDTYFDTGEVEFNLAEDLDPEVVDNDNQDEQDSDPNTWVYLFTRHPIPTLLPWKTKPKRTA